MIQLQESIRRKAAGTVLVLLGLVILGVCLNVVFWKHPPPARVFFGLAISIGLIFGGIYVFRLPSISTSSFEAEDSSDTRSVYGAVIIGCFVLIFSGLFPAALTIPLIALKKGVFSFVSSYEIFTYSYLYAGIGIALNNILFLTVFWALSGPAHREPCKWLVFFGGVVLGGVASLLMSPYITVGCSGGIYSLIGAEAIRILYGKRNVWQASVLIVSILGYVLPSMLSENSKYNISHAAHLGGFLCGLGIGVLIKIFDADKYGSGANRTVCFTGKIVMCIWCAGAVCALVILILK
jgi:membrane associated rhomboid family serine protease